MYLRIAQMPRSRDLLINFLYYQTDEQITLPPAALACRVMNAILVLLECWEPATSSNVNFLQRVYHSYDDNTIAG